MIRRLLYCALRYWLLGDERTGAWVNYLRHREIVVDRETGETARYYPDRAGGVLEGKDWWALCPPNALGNVAERFVSMDPETHICKIKKFDPSKRRIDVRYNPLSNEPSISIPCRICRSYSCCSPVKHGIDAIYEQALKMFTGEDKAETVQVKQGEGVNLTWESE